MENAINFIHSDDMLLTSSDGKLYKKSDNTWKEINNILYKSEFHTPSSGIGNNGDYYAKYYRKYNFFLYSEDFTQNAWNKVHCHLNKETTINFPYNSVTKITVTNENTEHGLDYLFYNELKTPYTFSIYVQKNEIQYISLSLSDQDNEYGYRLKANLINNTIKKESYGSTTDISNMSANIEKINDNVSRIWVTAQFKTTLILKASIRLLDDNENFIFSVPNETYGLFINGAQLVQSLKPEKYIYSNGQYANVLLLENLYLKSNNTWKVISNKLIYLNNLDNMLGENDDIACVEAILKLKPLILAGSSDNINRWHRPIGTLHYNKNKDKWYVTTKKGDYALQFKHPKPNYRDAAIAISLNQQIYQTYDRYGRPSLFKGFNTGGNYNFWIRNSGKTRL